MSFEVDENKEKNTDLWDIDGKAAAKEPAKDLIVRDRKEKTLPAMPVIEALNTYRTKDTHNAAKKKKEISRIAIAIAVIALIQIVNGMVAMLASGARTLVERGIIEQTDDLKGAVVDQIDLPPSVKLKHCVTWNGYIVLYTKAVDPSLEFSKENFDFDATARQVFASAEDDSSNTLLIYVDFEDEEEEEENIWEDLSEIDDGKGEMLIYRCERGEGGVVTDVKLVQQNYV